MKRVVRWALLLPLVAVTSTALIAASKPAPTPRCALRAWVTEHVSSLPQTYDQIIRYPLAYRRAIQGELPVKVRHEMWNAQYDLYVHSGILTGEQQEFVRVAKERLNILYSTSESAERFRPVADSVMRDAMNVLGRDLTRKIFTVLGPEVDTDSLNSRIPQFAAAVALRVAVPKVFINCTCHVIAGTSFSPPECPESRCSAFAIEDCNANYGCYTGGQYSCNGMCDGTAIGE